MMIDLAAVYSALEPDRQTFLERGHRSSVFTIPAILPRDGQSRDRLPQNYQSIGARGVNNLTAKLKLTLFPADLPFFRLTIDPFSLRELVAEFGGDPEAAAEAKAEVEKNLALIEETVRLEFHTSGWGTVINELLRHLVVVGNGLLLIDPKRGPQFADLRKFVVERDPEGNLLRVVLRQQIADHEATALVGPLPAEQRAEALAYGSAIKQRYLYTGAIRTDDGKYTVWQQVGSDVVPDSERLVPLEKLPIIPFVFTPISGENYGSGYVEEYDGDLLVLEGLSRAITEAALAAAKLLILVRPGSSTRISAVTKAPNGAVRQGHKDDVTAFSLEKQADLATAERRVAVIEQRLAYAFLLFSSVQRQAERVTAEEIRMASQELEDALGGVYTALAETLQKPIVNYLLSRVQARPNMPKLPPTVKPIVATGLEAISRGHKAARLTQWGGMMQSLVPPEELVTILRTEVVAREMATALSLDADTFIRNREEIQTIRTQQQNQSLTESLGPQAISAISKQQQA